MDYGLLNVVSNPFGQENMDVDMVNRKQDWSKITTIVQDQLQSEGAGYSVVLGDYGMGKTFTLIKIEEWLKEFKFDEESCLAIRLRTSDAQVPRSYVANLLTRINRYLGRKGLHEMAASIQGDWEQIREDTVRNVFQQASEKNELAFRWLFGRKLTARESRDLGVEYAIDDPKETSNTLFDFLRVYKLAKYRGIVVLFDELEYVLSNVSEQKVASIIHELQSIWDDFVALNRDEKTRMARFVGIFASSPDSWKRFLEIAEERQERTGGGGTETFLRRIPDDAYINLTPLKKSKDIREFLTERIKVYRPNTYRGADLPPLEEDYIPFIAKLTAGIPGKIVNDSGIVFRQASTDKVKKIDAKYALEVLKNYGLVVQVADKAG